MPAKHLPVSKSLATALNSVPSQDIPTFSIDSSSKPFSLIRIVPICFACYFISSQGLLTAGFDSYNIK
jgi:hypothetical protein